MSDRTAPSELWQTARWLLQTLFSIFGEPQEIAISGAVDRKTFFWLTTWLRAGETLLRRLLLIEANALDVPPALARRSFSEDGSSRQANAAGKMPAVRSPFSLNPDDWRVSFRCAAPYGSPASRRPAPAHAGETPAVQEGRRTYPAIPLAFRAEALFRVCKNPLPYARRLARLTARLPELIAAVLAPPHKRKRKSGDPPHLVDIIGRETWAALEAASPAPNSS